MRLLRLILWNGEHCSLRIIKSGIWTGQLTMYNVFSSQIILKCYTNVLNCLQQVLAVLIARQKVIPVPVPLRLVSV